MGGKDSRPVNQPQHENFHHSRLKNADLEQSNRHSAATKAQLKKTAENRVEYEKTGQLKPFDPKKLDNNQIIRDAPSDSDYVNLSLDEFIPRPKTERVKNADGTVTITTRTLIGTTSITIPDPDLIQHSLTEQFLYTDAQVVGWIKKANFPFLERFIHYVCNDNPAELVLFDYGFSVVHLSAALNVQVLYELTWKYCPLDVNRPSNRPLLGSDANERTRGKYFYKDPAEFLYEHPEEIKVKKEELEEKKTGEEEFAEPHKGPILQSAASNRAGGSELFPNRPPLWASLVERVQYQSSVPYFDHCQLDGELRSRDSGWTPLMFAIAFCDQVTIEAAIAILLARKADVNWPSTRCGITALMLAVRRREIGPIVQLFAANVNRVQKNVFGFDAADLAEENDESADAWHGAMERERKRAKRVFEILADPETMWTPDHEMFEEEEIIRGEQYEDEYYDDEEGNESQLQFDENGKQIPIQPVKKRPIDRDAQLAAAAKEMQEAYLHGNVSIVVEKTYLLADLAEIVLEYAGLKQSNDADDFT